MHVKLDTVGDDGRCAATTLKFACYGGDALIAPPEHVERLLMELFDEFEFSPINDETTRAIRKKLSYYGLDPDDNFQHLWLNANAHKHWQWVDAMGGTIRESSRS